MPDIYIVSYASGQYSDYFDRPVAWYETEAEAKEHAEQFDETLAAARAAHSDFLRLDPSPAFSISRNGLWEQHCKREEAWFAENHCVAALNALLGEEDSVSSFYSLRNLHPAIISRVPKGTLPLHGFPPEAQ